MCKFFILHFIFLFFSTLILYANPPSKKVFSIEATFLEFLKMSFQYQSLKEKLKSEFYNFEKAYSELLAPYIGLEVGYGLAGNLPIFIDSASFEKDEDNPQSPDFAKKSKEYHQHKIGASLKLHKVLYDFGRSEGNFNMIYANYDLEKFVFIENVNLLVKGFQMTFYQVLYYQILVDFFKKKMEIDIKISEHKKKLYQQGQLAEDEYLGNQIYLNEQENSLKEKMYDLLKKSNHFFLFLKEPFIENLKILENYRFEGSFENDFVFLSEENFLFDRLDLYRAYFSSKISESLNFKKYMDVINFFKKLQTEKFNPEILIEIALCYRPDFLKLHTQIKILEAKKLMKASIWKPEISIYGDLGVSLVNQDLEFDEDFKFNFGYSTGISFKIPFLDMINPKSKGHMEEKSVEKEIEALDYQIEFMKEKIKMEVIESYLNYNQSKEFLVSQKKILELAKNRYQFRLNEYEKGMIEYISYQKAFLEYEKYQLQYYEMQLKLKNHYINLISTLGF